MAKLYTLGAQLTRDRLLVEPDAITAEYDAEAIAAQQSLADANAAYQSAVQARRELQQKLGQLTAEAGNLRQQIREGMARALASEADAAFFEVEKARVRRARKLAQIQYTQVVLIGAADLAVKGAEIAVLEASADAREEAVAAKKLRLMLAGAAARAVTGGASVDVGPELAHVEKVIARDRESVLPGLSQELALMVEKHNKAVESVDGIFS